MLSAFLRLVRPFTSFPLTLFQRKNCAATAALSAPLFSNLSSVDRAKAPVPILNTKLASASC